MTDYELLIKELVYEKLKAKVRGKVSCWVKDDALHMKVTMINTEYEAVIKDLANRILHGFNADLMVYEFCKGYRNYVLGGYFR